MTRSYDIVEKQGARKATLIVGPADYQPCLFVGTVVYFDDDGDMRSAPPQISTTSADEAKSKAIGWIRKSLFSDFTETLHREW